VITAQSFSAELLTALARFDARATRLRARARGQAAIIGLDDDGEFVPLLRLAAPSAACNVMSLFVRHHGRWEPTCERGTPAQLAATLASPLRHVWAIAVDLAGSDGPNPA
jgi:hypothetical protein